MTLKKSIIDNDINSKHSIFKRGLIMSPEFPDYPNANPSSNLIIKVGFLANLAAATTEQDEQLRKVQEVALYKVREQERLELVKQDSLQKSSYLLNTVAPVVIGIVASKGIESDVTLGNKTSGWLLKSRWYATQESVDNGRSLGRDGLTDSDTYFYDVYDGIVLTSAAEMLHYNIKKSTSVYNGRDKKDPNPGFISLLNTTQITPSPHPELTAEWTQLVTNFVTSNNLANEVAARISTL